MENLPVYENVSNFDPANLFVGNSALGLANPVFEGMKGRTIPEMKDFLLLASKNTIKELAALTGVDNKTIANLIKGSIDRVAHFHGVAIADVRYAMQTAQRENGTWMRSEKEKSVVGAFVHEQEREDSAMEDADEQQTAQHYVNENVVGHHQVPGPSQQRQSSYSENEMLAAEALLMLRGGPALPLRGMQTE